MTLSATLDQEDAGQVATISGWSDVGQWVDGLDHEKYPEPVHLYEHGWSQHLTVLEKQLQQAVQEKPPDADTASVLKGLLNVLANRGAAAVLTVGDGVGVDGEDEEPSEGGVA